MKLHDNALAEVATLRAKNEEQSAKIRTLQTQLKEVRNELKEQSLRIGNLSGRVKCKAASGHACLVESVTGYHYSVVPGAGKWYS